MADVITLPSIPDQPVEAPKDEKFPEEQQEEVPSSQPLNPQSNSHPHDSEYDTASDLEGGDEDDYDDEDDEDESLGADGEEEDIDSENDSIVFDVERQRGDGQETDYAKKVDEDRSNPQYIPKKGTFYEHDDRTADDDERGENRAEEGGDGDTTKSSTPTISAGTKTMKKWQPASAVDRWSHDRYDESEQAPKSRSELVSAYGYDIRNEDGPPRARRRRRYGRGPTKYVRNWEDENAYIKAANPQRKPRPEDFPALGDKKRKSRSFREEKENRYERQGDRGPQRMSGGAPSPRDGKLERRSSGKSFRSGGRQSLDFKNQSKIRTINDSGRNPLGRTSEKNDGTRSTMDDGKSQLESVSFTNTSVGPSSQSDRYNGHDAMHHNQIPGHRDLKDKMNSSNHLNSRQSPQTSQLASRLQIQRGNDPLHVGSVQMHSLITPNQSDIQQPGGESGKTKRYSSLRQRSQNDPGVPTQNTQIDPHNLQQIQLHEHHQPQPPQQQQPQQQQAQHVLLPEQHLLQANLMQMYHTQDNLQMQSVAIQSLPAGHQAKPQFQNVQQQYQPQAQSTPAAYYASVNEYPTAPANPPALQPQYTQQQPTAYIQPPPPANPQIAAFNAQSPPPGPPVTQPIPTALNYVQPQSAATNPPYQNYSGYHQNFNTVGGTTYFVPQQAPPPRPVVNPQRRPTNAIPILAPPTDKAKKALGEKDDENKAMPSSNAPIGSAENIDHILDNMFVQRPPYQPPTSRKSSSPATESVGTSTSSAGEDKPAPVPIVATGTNELLGQAHLEESIKNLSISEEPIPLPAPSEHPNTSPPATAAPSEVVQNETG